MSPCEWLSSVFLQYATPAAIETKFTQAIQFSSGFGFA